MTKPRYLLDTNICIYLLGGGSGDVRARTESCREGELATSSVAFAEVMVGARTLDAEAEAEAFFDLVTVLPFDRSAAAVYAGLPFRRGSFDRLIAAHALCVGLTVVTNNERDYRDIPGLRVENWTRPQGA